METPLVSIITPTFNSQQFIEKAIKSVQNQTCISWEMIVIDDCSTDQTPSIVRELALLDQRIRFFRLEKNSGPGIARNTALQKAMGKYIAFLDSDDLWAEEKLEKQLAFMQSNGLKFTFSFYECIDEAGNALHKRIEAPKNLSYNQLVFCNYVGNLTGIYDAEYFGKITITSVRKRQDWILWLTILKKIKIAKPVPETLAFYRVRTNSISSSKIDLIKYNYRVYTDFHRHNVIIAGLCMCGFLFTQLFIKPLYSKLIKPSK